MKRTTLVASAVGLVLAVAAVGCAPTPPPAADPVVDQLTTVAPTASYFFTGTGTNSLGGGSNLITGQVFAAGITGTMPTVSLSFQQDTFAPVPTAVLSVSVTAAGANGLPTGPTLATATYTGLGSVGRALVDLTLSTPVPVTQGQRYAILASSANAVWQVNQTVAASPHGPYLGGDVFVFNTFVPTGATQPVNDLYFRTWVVPA